jgi:CBS-domain-containing membrane protein
MKVEQNMNRGVKTCGPQDSLNRAAQIMWEEACGAVPVVDEQSRPIGFLTDRDICMAAYTQGKRLDALRVEKAMARKVVSCGVEDDLGSAAQLMRQNRTRRLPVIDQNGALVGLLSLDDLACEAARSLRGGVNDELRNLVLEVHLSINRGRVRLHPAAQIEREYGASNVERLNPGPSFPRAPSGTEVRNFPHDGHRANPGSN